MGLFDQGTFNAQGGGLLAQLYDAGGGQDNSGWQALRQLLLGPQGGTVDRMFNGGAAPSLPGGTPMGQGGIGSDYAQAPPMQAPPLPAPINVQQLPTPAQPDQAMLPPAARPAQYQPPQAASGQQAPAAPRQMPEPPGGNNLMAGLQGFANSPGLLPALTNMMGGFATGHRQDPTGMALENQKALVQGTYQALVSRGMSPTQAVAIAQGILANPKLGETILPQALGLNPPKTPEEYLARKMAGESFPTANGASGPTGSNPMAEYNDYLRQKASTEALGKAQGANQASLPNALGQADTAISLIDSISKDPNLSKVIGTVAGRIPAIGGEQANVISKIDQLKGHAFLQAWESLKGAGARITAVEALKATDAVARLQRVQSVDGFQKALTDLRDVVSGVRTRAGIQAGVGATPPQQQQSQAAPSFSQDQLLAEAKRRGLVK